MALVETLVVSNKRRRRFIVDEDSDDECATAITLETEPDNAVMRKRMRTTEVGSDQEVEASPTGEIRPITSIVHRRAKVVVPDSDDEVEPDELALAMIWTLPKSSPPRLNPSIDLQGNARFPCYSLRLHECLRALYEIDPLQMGPGWFEAFHAKSVDQWHEDVSSITLPETKDLLSQEHAPPVRQILGSLPEIDGDKSPGSYFGGILTDRKLHKGPDFVFVGSATGIITGLEGRTDQHGDPEYRAYQRTLLPSYHYNIVDQDGRGRVEYFRKLAVAKYTSTAAEHINEVKAICLVSEEVYMSWLRAFAGFAERAHPEYINIGPWTEAEYLGTNIKPPFKAELGKVVNDALALTAEEHYQRRNEKKISDRANRTEMQHQLDAARNRDYHRRVRQQEIAMMTEGATEEEALAFRKAQRRKLLDEGRDRKLDLHFKGGDPDFQMELEPHLELRPVIKKTKRGTACAYCRKSKLRCDGQSPCSRCTERGLICEPQAVANGSDSD